MHAVDSQQTKILDLLPEAVAITRFSDSLVRYANPCFSELFGLTPAQLAAGVYTLDLYVRPEDRERIKDLLAAGQAPRFEVEMRRADGQSFWGMLLSAKIDYEGETCILGTLADISDDKWIDLKLTRSEEHYRALAENARDAAGEPVEVLRVDTDITHAEEQLRAARAELQAQYATIAELQAELRGQSVRDPLTGAFNRCYLQETLARELARCQRERMPLSLVMVDADNLKSVNDTHGHKAGDMILQALTNHLITACRAGDIVCRYGGEEFVVLMPDADLSTAVERAESWRRAYAAQAHANVAPQIHSTISVGVGTFPTHGGDEEALLRAADHALYIAKSQGRNRVEPAPDGFDLLN